MPNQPRIGHCCTTCVPRTVGLRIGLASRLEPFATVTQEAVSYASMHVGEAHCGWHVFYDAIATSESSSSAFQNIPNFFANLKLKRLCATANHAPHSLAQTKTVPTTLPSSSRPCPVPTPPTPSKSPPPQPHASPTSSKKVSPSAVESVGVSGLFLLPIKLPTQIGPSRQSSLSPGEI